MTVHYCDRCKRSAEKLTHHKIPDAEKCHSATSYGTKEVELCDTCLALVRRSEEKFLNAIIETKFAFYKAIMTVDSESIAYRSKTNRYGTNWERLYEPTREANDYCSYGERREE